MRGELEGGDGVFWSPFVFWCWEVASARSARGKKRHATFGFESQTVGGCTDVMHGRSRMTLDARASLYTMPGWSTSGFHRPGRHCLHQARSSAVRCREEGGFRRGAFSVGRFSKERYASDVALRSHGDPACPERRTTRPVTRHPPSSRMVAAGNAFVHP